jgi:hypothetical protein
VLLLAVGAAWLGLFLRHKGLSWAVSFSAIAGFVFAGLALAGPVVKKLVRWGLGHVPGSRPDIRKVRDDLARSLRQQWADSERLHQVNDPRPLPVRWEVTQTSRDTAPAAAGTLPATSAQEPSAGACGQFDDIAAAFRGISAHRLIILGGPGAGKSILVTKLAHDLLSARRPGTLVPVIMPAISWDTGTSLSSWIARQLGRDHPGLNTVVRTATGAATPLADLVAADGVLPIIDGLDELPAPQRSQAVTQINAAGSDIPLVVTSRPDEYLAAIIAAGRPVSRAEVVELLPLQVAEVKAYLGEATAAGTAGRWDPAFDQLDAEPDGPLIQVLSTPLMIWLARTVYDSGDSTPAELADRGRLASQQAIEQHLLDRLVPAVYARSAHHPRRHGFRCTARQAERWLSFLAAHVREEGSADIAWWRLPRAARFWLPAGTAIRAALLWGLAWYLIVWAMSVFGSWRHGRYTLHSGLRAMLFGGPAGRLAWPAASKLGHAVSGSLRHWLHQELPRGASLWQSASPFFPWHSFALSELIVVLLAAFFGTTLIGEGNTGTGPWQPRILRIKPARTAGETVIAIVSLGLVDCLLIAGLLYFFAAPQRALTVTSFFSQWQTWQAMFLLSLFGLATVPQSFKAPLDVSQSLGPSVTLRRDRQADVTVTMLSGASFALVVWLWTGPVGAIAYGVYAAAATVLRLLLGSIDDVASQRYTSTRFWLACNRRLPWRLMAFLSDARTRGVLRQVGDVYQFRHPRLQECLAAKRPPRSVRLFALAGRALGGQRTLDLAVLQRHIREGWLGPDPRSPITVRRAGLAHIYHDERFATRQVNAHHRPPGGHGSPPPGYDPDSLLLDDEREVFRIRLHPAVFIAPSFGALGALFWAGVSGSLVHGAVQAVIWLAFALTLINLTYQIFKWRVSYFIVTDQRIVIAEGLLRRTVSRLALATVSDINCRRSSGGTLFGYGEFIIESAAEQQPRIINYLPYPREIYHETCDLIFADGKPDRQPDRDAIERQTGTAPGPPANDLGGQRGP